MHYTRNFNELYFFLTPRFENLENLILISLSLSFVIGVNKALCASAHLEDRNRNRNPC